jgi:membrane-associated phospholipid phosphatase
MTTESPIMTEPSIVTPPAFRGPVRYWNQVLLSVHREVGGGPGPLARSAAMMHGTIFDVVNNQTRVDRCLDFLPYLSYVGLLPATAGANVVDAVNIAARDVLLALHPGSEETIVNAFTRLYPTTPPPVTSALGQAAARAMLLVRASDGADAPTTYVPPNVPGAWRVTTPGAEPVTPHWGQVTPFSGETGSVFRPPLPAGFDNYADLLASQVYAEQVTEVQTLGRSESSARTADQTEAAWFWAHDLDGTQKPAGHLLRLTDEIAPPADLLAEARLFALMSFALADALITAWDSKFDTALHLWRPESAIRLAGTDGNLATKADTTWQPLSATRNGTHFSPAFPAYVSGHATLAGAWAGVLQSYFGTDVWSFTASSEDPHLPTGTTRSFERFSQAAVENARSRVYLGVHYQFDADRGLAAGALVAKHVFRTRAYRVSSQ